MDWFKGKLEVYILYNTLSYATGFIMDEQMRRSTHSKTSCSATIYTDQTEYIWI